MTLFTPDPAQANTRPKIKIADSEIPLVRSPKLLGVYLDTFFSFNKHCVQVANRVSKRNNVLKALAGTNWGQQKETLLMTYKVLGRSIANYAAPVCSINASETNIGKIQRAPLATEHIIALYNDSHKSFRLPSIWKTSLVIPIPKPGKESSQGTSYRPIWLLYPAVKVLEALNLLSINKFISPVKINTASDQDTRLHLPSSSSQHTCCCCLTVCINC